MLYCGISRISTQKKLGSAISTGFWNQVYVIKRILQNWLRSNYTRWSFLGNFHQFFGVIDRMIYRSHDERPRIHFISIARYNRISC